MILVDTSIWVDHLRSGDARLVRLLESGGVLVHPFVVGVLAFGSLGRRAQVTALSAGASLWTRDKRLAAAAMALDLGSSSPSTH